MLAFLNSGGRAHVRGLLFDLNQLLHWFIYFLPTEKEEEQRRKEEEENKDGIKKVRSVKPPLIIFIF